MDEPRVPDPRPERLLVALLSDPQIWTTVQALARSDVHAADLQAQTGLSAPGLTNLLDRLREAGLITSRPSNADPRM